MDDLNYILEAELARLDDRLTGLGVRDIQKIRITTDFSAEATGGWRCDLLKWGAWRRIQQGRGKIKISVESEMPVRHLGKNVKEQLDILGWCSEKRMGLEI